MNEFQIGDIVIAKRDKRKNPIGIIADIDGSLCLVNYPNRFDSFRSIQYCEEHLIKWDEYMYNNDFQEKIKDRLGVNI